jgi:hypothetical protein
MTALSEAVAAAHMERAKSQARDVARILERVVYIFPTRAGLKIDPVPPMVADYFWSVSPDGTVALIKRKGF